MSFQEFFTEVNPTQAHALLEAKEGGILFIGRETCPYCRRFAPKLAKVASEQGWTVHFLNSEDFANLDAIEALRAEYGVTTVPGFLYAGADGVKVRCDSGMSEEEIAAFVD